MKLEQRILTNNSLEVREKEEGGIVAGYGIVYNQRAQIWDDLWEVVLPGAASEFLSGKPDIRCCYNHDRNYLLGRTKSGTLTVSEDENGVYYEAQIPDAQWARDLYASLSRRDIDGSSFTFGVDPKDEKITKQDDGTYLREIHRLSVVAEMGPVTAPAYEASTAHVRSKEELYDSFAEYLRAQDTTAEIADTQRALELRKKRLDLLEKEMKA